MRDSVCFWLFPHSEIEAKEEAVVCILSCLPHILEAGNIPTVKQRQNTIVPSLLHPHSISEIVVLGSWVGMGVRPLLSLTLTGSYSEEPVPSANCEYVYL
jgi:hypothetical protein